MPDVQQLVQQVRRIAKLPVGSGPSDEVIAAAVIAFAEKFEYWYTRVMAESVPKYRRLIIARINPFVRRIDCAGLTSEATAARLVRDYDSRNFVTAGGWAIEALAINLGGGHKSAAVGIDIQRVANDGAQHLYVVKSGLVTRNSDILAQLKRNCRDAEKRLRQSGATGHVVGNWAIAAGRTSSTFEDGIRRPSSAEFWSEMSGLPEGDAIELVLAIAFVAGSQMNNDGAVHAEALQFVVAQYISKPDAPEEVDWEFICARTLSTRAAWADEDRVRHKRAMRALKATGYGTIASADEELVGSS